MSCQLTRALASLSIRWKAKYLGQQGGGDGAGRWGGRRSAIQQRAGGWGEGGNTVWPCTENGTYTEAWQCHKTHNKCHTKRQHLPNHVLPPTQHTTNSTTATPPINTQLWLVFFLHLHLNL